MNHLAINMKYFAPILLSILTHSSETDENMLYGVCYQRNTLDSAQIIPLTQEHILSFQDYGFDISSNEHPINCLWFTTNDYAHSASRIKIATALQYFENNQENVQPSNDENIVCNNQEIQISDSCNTISNHLCSDMCQNDNDNDNESGTGSCSTFLSSQTIPRSMHESNVKPLIPSMFGISGIVIAFIVLCSMVYCFAIKYSKWTDKRTNNETEEVIGDVLNEIAKYTIGDSDEEGFYGDWMDAAMDSDDDASSSSSTTNKEQIGMTILKVVSNQSLPDLPNPSIIDSLSSSSSCSGSSCSSEDEEIAQDLLVAKQTLNANYSNYTSNYGGNYNSYSCKLKTIKENVIKKTVDITPKKAALLSGCESSDCKLSSDANNSDLP